MKKIICLILISLALTACAYPPLTIERRIKAYAIEYFDACPPFEAMFNTNETLAFICDDGQTVTFSNYERHWVVIQGRTKYIKTITTALGKLGKTLADVDLVIHNHFIKEEFSSTDKFFYFGLRKNGFRGTFALYHVPTKEIFGVNDNGKLL